MTTPREAKSLASCVCRFQRCIPVPTTGEGPTYEDGRWEYKAGGWETGIAILPWPHTSNVTLIVDLDGKPVDRVWNYNLCHYQGCFTASDVDEFYSPTQEEELKEPEVVVGEPIAIKARIVETP